MVRGAVLAWAKTRGDTATRPVPVSNSLPVLRPAVITRACRAWVAPWAAAVEGKSGRRCVRRAQCARPQQSSHANKASAHYLTACLPTGFVVCAANGSGGRDRGRQDEGTVVQPSRARHGARSPQVCAEVPLRDDLACDSHLKRPCAACCLVCRMPESQCVWVCTCVRARRRRTVRWASLAPRRADTGQ